ncbi:MULTISPECIES: Slp family lipoprotein [Deferrisoma]
MRIRNAFLLIGLLLLASCAAHLDARTDDEVPPRFSHLLAEADRRVGQFVVIGGVVEEVRATETGTELRLLHKPIDGWDRPRTDRLGDGRILAQYDAELDPRLFSPGRAVTVVGELAGTAERTEGDATRRYLVVKAAEVRAWSRRELARTPFSRAEAWYPPWYDPAVGTRPWWW